MVEDHRTTENTHHEISTLLKSRRLQFKTVRSASQGYFAAGKSKSMTLMKMILLYLRKSTVF